MSLSKFFFDYNKQDSFVNNLRKKRFSILENRLDKLIAHKDSFKILDIGGETAYWKNLGWDNAKCQIYLLNLYKNNIDEKDANRFHSIIGNALEMPFLKNEFDLIFSNSVIEHLGTKDNQKKFALEVTRLCDKYIIQTPSFWFPLEPHSRIPFFQFIPHRLRAYLIMTFNINYFPKAKTYKEALEVSRSTMMFNKNKFQQLFPDAEIQVERLFGIPKSYTAVKL